MTSLSTKLAEREASGKPIQIGLIGAGKFGSMLYVMIATSVPENDPASIDIV
jgi:predicted homoserine dehydrogenase-like protein